uniref:Uncharacterized protein n=1 Tax=Arundo donax TaxID=35708 RepID=A0A0A9HXW6_ARUDO
MFFRLRPCFSVVSSTPSTFINEYGPNSFPAKKFLP